MSCGATDAPGGGVRPDVRECRRDSAIGRPEPARWHRRIEARLIRRCPAAAVAWGTLPHDDPGIDAVHRFHADILIPMIGEVLARHGHPMDDIHALQALHRRAATAVPVTEAQWIAVLVPVLHVAFRHAYPYRAAYDRAHRSALHYAAANHAAIERGFGSAEAYARYYAALNSDAAADFFAAANARAHADLCARSYAARNAHAYAATRPDVRVGALLAAAAALSMDTTWLCERLAHGLRDCIGTGRGVGRAE